MTRKGIAQIIRYTTVGAFTNGLAFACYLLLTETRLQPELCAFFVYVLAALAGYLANHRWTFASKAMHRKAMPKFLCAHLTGAACQFLVIAILYRALHIHHQVAQLVSLGSVSIILYILLKHVVFPESQAR